MKILKPVLITTIIMAVLAGGAIFLLTRSGGGSAELNERITEDQRDEAGEKAYRFDIDKTTVHKNNRNYLSNVEKRGKIISVADKIPKSFIVCKSKSENIVYITPLAPITLFKRISGKT